MVWLVLGLALWTGAHLFRRVAPAAREKMGAAGKGAVALAILAGLVLIVIGYGRADGAAFWGRTPMTTGLNNLLMLLAVYLFLASVLRTTLARKMRHPMLAGVKVWALAHLLVNGDVPSFVLFGGLLAWAVVQMIVINKAEREWERPAPAALPKEILAAGGSVAVFAGIAVLHMWLGYGVFG